MLEKQFVLTSFLLCFALFNFLGVVYLLRVVEQLKTNDHYWKKKLQSFLGINYNRKGKTR